MSWKITSHKCKAILITITLLLTTTNSWLSMECPFFLGFVSESPVAIYRFRFVCCEISDYGSEGSVHVMEDFGNFCEGILIALGKEFIYRAGRYEYLLKRDYTGIVIFFLYLISLAVNIALLVMSPTIVRKISVRRLLSPLL